VSDLEIGALPGALEAALISGLDPARDAGSTAARERIRDALAVHGVLCIRGAGKLDKEGFRAVAEMFGPIKDPVARAKDGSLFRYSEERQAIDAGFVMTDEFREKMGDQSFGGLDAQRPGLFETFHIDDTYTEEPASVTVLHARALPPSGGGNTLFLDLRAAYELLPAAEQRRLRPLRAVHAYNNEGAFPSRQSSSGAADVLPPVSYPVVRTHPRTGELGLFFDLDRAMHVEDLPLAEGRGLLESLQAHAEAKAPRYEHEWQPFDVLVWDNARVQHKAAGNFPIGEPRRFWRHMIEGTRPV